MFNAPEVTNEYNLLNDFLNNSLLDDGALLPEDTSNFYTDQSGAMLPGGLNNTSGAQQPMSLGAPSNAQGSSISRPNSVIPTDKAREYYLQAADPTGNDAPEERMQRLLKAKYDAGMLKPFNYVKGYLRLSAYMDGHIQPVSKQKILRQLDRFRPKFREKVQALTDIELIYVEMWFERSLMEYDRVFASMAIPACCWRRTGEIFRGNKEMAELVHVPIEKLRDVRGLALHYSKTLLTISLGQDCVARNTFRRIYGQLLGEVRGYSFRPKPEGSLDELFSEESRRSVQRSNNQVLLFIYDKTR
jgi:hypothetical protein